MASAAGSRKRKKQPLGQQEAVPLPHDGPLYHQSRCRHRRHQHVESLGERKTPHPRLVRGLEEEDELQQCVELLTKETNTSENNNNNDDDNDDTDKSSEARTRRLLRELSQCQRIEQQLTKIQTFKGQLIQSTLVDSGFLETFTAVALYRILLEWSVSAQTPGPLRKSLHSLLDALMLAQRRRQSQQIAAVSGQNSSSLETTSCVPLFSKTFVTVLESITSASYSSSPFSSWGQEKDDKSNDETLTVWSKPLHSLDALLSLAMLQDETWAKERSKMKKRDNEDGENNNGVQETLEISQDQTPRFVSLILVRVWPFFEHLVSQQALPQVIQLSATMEKEKAAMTQHDKDGVLEKALHICLVIKTLLECLSTPIVSERTPCLPTPSCRHLLTEFTWSLLACPWTPTASMVVVAMAHGQLLGLHDEKEPANGDDETENKRTKKHWTEKLSRHDQPLPNNLSDLARAFWLQGLLAATATDNDLFERGDNVENQSDNTEVLVWSFLDELIHLVSHSAEIEVRLVALKGLRTLTNRCATWINAKTSDDTRAKEKEDIEWLSPISDRLLECVLESWEKPSLRKMANAIPPLFDAALDLSLLVSSDGEKRRLNDCDNQPHPISQELVHRFLQQPPNRKGRYKALELLLPRVGAKRLLQAAESTGNSNNGKSENNALLGDLLERIAEVGDNTGPISDLWAKLLRDLLEEIIISPAAIDKGGSTTNVPEMVLPENWTRTWVPSLARVLVEEKESKRRRQVVAFCFPKIKEMVSCLQVKDQQNALAATFSSLIDYIHFKLEPAHTAIANMPSTEHETFRDRQLWTLCEVVKSAAVERLLPSSGDLERFAFLDKSVAAAIPMKILREALLHFSHLVRVSAFQSMGAIVSTYPRKSEKIYAQHTREEEMVLWKETLPYAIKTDNKDYVSSLLYCVLPFMDRLCQNESTRCAESTNSEKTSGLYDFVVNFLINDLLLRKSAYPGSVLVKETFALSLLECITMFVCRESESTRQSKLLSKAGKIFNRKRSQAEEDLVGAIRRHLLSERIVTCLDCLLHSSWNNIRITSFQVLSRLILIGRIYHLPIPTTLCFSNSIDSYDEKRAFYLLSSPRQREADNGARSIALQCLSRSSFQERIETLSRLIELLGQRIKEMKNTLEEILSNSQDLSKGGKLSLAHGIIQAISLTLESPVLQDQGGTIPEDLLQKLAITFCAAIQISLSVVADVKDGQVLEGLEDDTTSRRANTNLSTSGKINPGSIGANGIFASVKRLDSVELQRRQASQRIIMGSWLLMKEACNGISSIMTSRDNASEESPVILNRAGMLMINTLTSLKHTGAAYAGHIAFQHIVQHALESKHLQHLPVEWTERLFSEITLYEKVRDSTLRRSTGYALGFLSIMRSEVSLRKSPRPLCRNIILRIMGLSMPANEWLGNFFNVLFDTRRRSDVENLFGGEVHEHSTRRTRVHALNVLRMVVSDAPLNQDVQPFIGNAIATAIVGYFDPEWGVRNSSSMVFSACLLRAVDADKNAGNSEQKSSNAVTLTGLFRCYPHLPRFLKAVLVGSLAGKFREMETPDMPPILPILILLYRVQSSRSSDRASVDHFASFLPVAMGALNHKNLAIRKAAARAVGNMASSHSNSSTFFKSILNVCFERIQKKTAWNTVHGNLLAIRELLQTAPILTCNSWECGFDSVVFGLVSKNHEMAVPPLCTAEAILVLNELCKVDNNSRIDLEELCFSTLSSRFSSCICHVGVSELLRVTAIVAITHVLRRWSRAVDNSCCIPEQDTRKVSSLLRCAHIDARIVTSKFLKKAICELVDQILVCSEKDEGFACKILTQLIEILTSSLSFELMQQSDGRLAPHPPILRRLSFALLECVNAKQKLVSLDAKEASDIRKVGNALWFAKNSQTILANSDPMSEDINASTLLGNALQLLCWANETKIGNTLFPTVVQRFSSATMPWKLRYASAVATKIISSRSSHAGMLSTLQTLLQDDDMDVRYFASRTLKHSAGGELVPVSEVRLLSLRESVELTSFLSKLKLLTSITLEKVCVLSDELLEINKIGRLEELTNFGTARKIFEDEAPNSYIETAMDFQNTLRMLLDSNESVDKYSINDKSVATECCDNISALLSHLSKLPKLVLMDVLRSRVLFSEMHSSILGVACFFYLGLRGEESVEVLQKAKQIVQAEGYLLIVDALNVLIGAMEGSISKQDIYQRCFLLLHQYNPAR